MTAVSTVSAAGWQTGFMSVLPAIKTHAKIRFRNLPAGQREEAIQETIAAACMHYQLAAAQGKLDAVKPGPLADFAARHVRTGRHVGGRQDAARDAMSAVAQTRHGFGITSIDQFDKDTGGWRQMAIEDRRTAIPDLAAFRIDFARWLWTLTKRDRKVIAALVRGERTSDVAQRFGISPGRVSQLRRKFELLWLTFQGEATGEQAVV